MQSPLHHKAQSPTSPTSAAANSKKPEKADKLTRQVFTLNNNVSKKEFLRFFIYIILLYLIIFKHLDIPNSYSQNTYFINILSNSGSLDLLFPTYTVDLETALNATVVSILLYNENAKININNSVSNSWLFNNSLLLKPITDLRILQSRVATVSNASIVWKNPLEYIHDFYGPDDTYFYRVEDDAFPAFVPLFTTSNYSTNMTYDALGNWSDLLINHFFDAHTQLVNIDFAYVSKSLNILTYMKLINQVLPSGVSKTDVDIRTFSFGFFGSSISLSDKVIEIAYFVFFSYYFIVMFVKVYYDIKHVEIDEEMLGVKKKTEGNKTGIPAFNLTTLSESNKNNKWSDRIKSCSNEILEKCIKPKRFILRIIIGLKRHLSQTNNLIDLFANIMNILAIIIIINLTFMYDFFNEFDDIARGSATETFRSRNFVDVNVQNLFDMNHKIELLSVQLMNYQLYCALFAIVQCFSSSLQRFFTIISNILDVLFFYLLLIAVIFLSFVLLVRNYFGYQIPEFTNIYATSVYLFGMISGYNDYLTTMWNTSPEFTLFFHIAYNFIIVFILMNMFLVIVKNEFSRFQSEINKKSKGDGKDSNLSRFKYKPSFVSVIKEKLKSWHLSILYYIRHKQYDDKKKEEKDMDLHLRNDVNLYNHIDFDVNFVDMLKKYQNIQGKNSMVEAEKARLNQNKMKESVKGIWQLLFLMIALALYIFLVTEFFQTEENYALSSSVIQSLEKPYANPQQNDASISITDATNINDILYYLVEIFPNSFFQKYYYNPGGSNTTVINTTLIKENPSFNEFMFLVNRKIRFTIRKRITTNNTNYFKNVNPISIGSSFAYDTSDSTYEFTDDFDFIKYDKSKSYYGSGGYVFFVNPISELSDKILEYNNNKFFDESLNSITLDFVLVNVIKNKFLYCLMVFQFGDTGGVQVIDLALPYRRINFNSVLDICITVLLCIISFVYFVYVFKFVKAVVFKVESYQTWYSMFIKHTIPETLLYHRERKQPEFFRKISYVFDFKSVLNILFFIFTGVFMILMILLQINVLEIENRANIFGTDLAEMMKFFTWRLFENPGETQNIGDYINMSVKLMQMLDLIALFSALSAFILVFQILYYYSKKNSFFVIIHSILVSLKEIPFMIAVLLSFLFTFAMYGYLLLGKIHPKFNSFQNSVRTLFEYLSHIDDINFFMQDNYMMAFLTLLVPFFLSVKLVIINMFFSIIYRAYEKSKIEGEKEIIEEVKISFKDFWVFTYKLLVRDYEEKDNNLELYSQMLHKTDIEGLFIKMKDTIRISNQNTNIHIWANICSEEIRNEHEKRNFLREKCDEIMKNYFFKNSAGEHKYFRLLGRNLNKKCVEYELRKNYWEYFRIAHQYLNRYDFYFKNRINELNDRLKNKEVLEKEKETENEALKTYIADLLKRFEDNKNDIIEVKKEIKKIQIEIDLHDAKKTRDIGRISLENSQNNSERDVLVVNSEIMIENTKSEITEETEKITVKPKRTSPKRGVSPIERMRSAVLEENEENEDEEEHKGGLFSMKDLN